MLKIGLKILLLLCIIAQETRSADRPPLPRPPWELIPAAMAARAGAPAHGPATPVGGPAAPAGGHGLPRGLVSFGGPDDPHAPSDRRAATRAAAAAGATAPVPPGGDGGMSGIAPGTTPVAGAAGTAAAVARHLRRTGNEVPPQTGAHSAARSSAAAGPDILINTPHGMAPPAPPTAALLAALAQQKAPRAVSRPSSPSNGRGGTRAGGSAGGDSAAVARHLRRTADEVPAHSAARSSSRGPADRSVSPAIRPQNHSKCQLCNSQDHITQNHSCTTCRAKGDHRTVNCPNNGLAAAAPGAARTATCQLCQDSSHHTAAHKCFFCNAIGNHAEEVCPLDLMRATHPPLPASSPHAGGARPTNPSSGSAARPRSRSRDHRSRGTGKVSLLPPPYPPGATASDIDAEKLKALLLRKEMADMAARSTSRGAVAGASAPRDREAAGSGLGAPVTPAYLEICQLCSPRDANRSKHTTKNHRCTTCNAKGDHRAVNCPNKGQAAAASGPATHSECQLCQERSHHTAAHQCARCTAIGNHAEAVCPLDLMRATHPQPPASAPHASASGAAGARATTIARADADYIAAAHAYAAAQDAVRDAAPDARAAAIARADAAYIAAARAATENVAAHAAADAAGRVNVGEQRAPSRGHSQSGERAAGAGARSFAPSGPRDHSRDGAAAGVTRVPDGWKALARNVGHDSGAAPGRSRSRSRHAGIGRVVRRTGPSAPLKAVGVSAVQDLPPSPAVGAAGASRSSRGRSRDAGSHGADASAAASRPPSRGRSRTPAVSTLRAGSIARLRDALADAGGGSGAARAPRSGSSSRGPARAGAAAALPATMPDPGFDHQGADPHPSGARQSKGGVRGVAAARAARGGPQGAGAAHKEPAFI